MWLESISQYVEFHEQSNLFIMSNEFRSATIDYWLCPYEYTYVKKKKKKNKIKNQQNQQN